MLKLRQSYRFYYRQAILFLASSSFYSQRSSIIIMRYRHNLLKQNNSFNLKQSSTQLHSKLIIPKINSSHSTPKSLSQSTLSQPLVNSSKLIHLPQSYYNDRKDIYQKRSRALSEKSLSFQSKHITISQRKRYQTSKTEDVIVKRKKERSVEDQCSSEDKLNIKSMKQRFIQLSKSKYQRLVFGKEIIKTNNRLLNKEIGHNLSQKKISRWSSPFKGQDSMKKLRGKDLLPRSIIPILPPSNPSHLKVLNLDRMFRVKQGKLANVVPLPVPRLTSVNTREYIQKSVRHQDKIHEAIQQYNKLMRMSEMENTVKKLGIKGKNFTKSPTIQQIMGIKLGIKKQITLSKRIIDSNILTTGSPHFKRCVKDQPELIKRTIFGLIQDSPTDIIDMHSYTLFWKLFVSRTANMEQKVQFLTYFFIPKKTNYTSITQMRSTLQIMCRELPQIDKLNLKAQSLTKQQRSKIFLQALIRVLFGETASHKDTNLNRELVEQVLYTNPEASELLIKLLQNQQ